ncbi:MAG: hypothetical protein ACRDZ8_21920 [Acidimicrobiales bacterium]
MPRIRRPAAAAVVLLLAGACGGSAHARAAPVSRSTTSLAGAPVRQAITTAATSLSRILDEDLNGDGDLLVPQNRYDEDVEKLAVAVAAAEAVVSGAPLSARQVADVDRWLAETSSLVPALQRSAPGSLTALRTAASDLSVVQGDLGL